MRHSYQVARVAAGSDCIACCDLCGIRQADRQVGAALAVINPDAAFGAPRHAVVPHV